MKKRILIIDDEVSFTWLVKLNLEETGKYVVLIENNSRNALTAIEKHQPNLILLDIIMPGMEGPDVFSEIRKLPKWDRIPVVFLTATIRKKEVESHQGLIRGRAFLAKPSSLNDLIDTIEKNMSLSLQ